MHSGVYYTTNIKFHGELTKMRKKKITSIIITLCTILLLLSSVVAALEPCPVYYTRDAGTFFYSNNPEPVTEAELGDQIDTDNPGKILYQEKGIYGECIAFISHRNATNEKIPIYFGIQLYNNSNTGISVIVRNRGYQCSGDWNGIECWSDYLKIKFENSTYTPNVYYNRILYIPPEKGVWILGGLGSNPVKFNNVANGAVWFTVTGGNADINFYAYKNFNSLSGNAVPLDYIHGGREGRAYKGRSDSLPILRGNFAWDIDDSTENTILPVKNDLNESALIWKTNFNSHGIIEPGAIGRDMISFAFSGWYFSNDTKDFYDEYCNLGNWGVQYIHTFNITNNGNNARKICVYMKNDSPVLVVNDKNGVITSPNIDVLVHEFMVNGKSRVSEEVKFILPANSNGGITHYVKVE